MTDWQDVQLDTVWDRLKFLEKATTDQAKTISDLVAENLCLKTHNEELKQVLGRIHERQLRLVKQ